MRQVCDAGGGADAVCKVDGLRYASSVTGSLAVGAGCSDAAGDLGDEVSVGADAGRVETAAGCAEEAGYAGLLESREDGSLARMNLIVDGCGGED